MGQTTLSGQGCGGNWGGSGFMSTRAFRRSPLGSTWVSIPTIVLVIGGALAGMNLVSASATERTGDGTTEVGGWRQLTTLPTNVEVSSTTAPIEAATTESSVIVTAPTPTVGDAQVLRPKAAQSTGPSADELAAAAYALGGTPAQAEVPQETVPAQTVPPTQVTTPTVDRGPALQTQMGIDLAMLLPGWSIYYLGPRDGLRGTTFPYDHRIEIYVRDSFTDAELAHVIAHEVGHALDVTYLDDADRQSWLSARGATGRPWWTGSGLSDFAVGAGDFAESYAWSRMGYGPWYSEVAGQPSAEQIAFQASLIG